MVFSEDFIAKVIDLLPKHTHLKDALINGKVQLAFNLLKDAFQDHQSFSAGSVLQYLSEGDVQGLREKAEKFSKIEEVYEEFTRVTGVLKGRY